MHKKAIVGLMGVLVLTGAVLRNGIAFADDSVDSGSTTNNTTNTVSSSASANASVTVSAACSFERSGSGEYAGILANNASIEVAGSTFSTICNDSGGYAIYAVGYGNNTLGNTDLIFNNDPSSSNNITTNSTSATSTSYWQMKLTAGAKNQPVLENGYGNYSVVPSTYTKVASYASAGTGTAQTVAATYKAAASSTQSAGTYTGAVKYTMVHPNTNIPNQPYDCAAEKICYFPNAGNTVADTMGNQSISSSDTSATLWASNFKRPGYGFAGWSDAYDYVVNEGSESNPDASIYGPNEDITFDAGQYSGTDGGLSLYAVWAPVVMDNQKNELTFQTTGLLSKQLSSDSNDTLANKPNDYVTALRDERDGQVYAVAKLADDNYWMIENLRLNNNSTTPNWGNNSLSQGFGGVFNGLADAESGNFSDTTNKNTLYDTTNITGSMQGYRFPRYNNSNTSGAVANMASVDDNVYSYGNYYTWAAALANTNHYTGPEAQVDGKTSETANTSICPSGWRLPYGRDTGNGTASGGFYNLNYKINNDSNVTDATASKNLRVYPNNFVYSGYFRDSSAYGRGSYGGYWPSTADTSNFAYYLAFSSSLVFPGTSIGSKYIGHSVRCVLGS